MGDFINQTSFVRFFCSNQELNLLNVGYDDFSVVKPATAFRMQTFYTWHFVLSGSGTLEIYNKKYQIKSGEMFFIPPDTKMRYYPDETCPWEYVWFAFKGDKIVQYSELAGFSSDTPVCGNQNFQIIKKVLKRLFDMLIDGGSGHFSVLSAFFEIMEVFTTAPNLNEIQQVKRMLDENFAIPDFSIDQLCCDVGISHAHLLRMFKEAYGVTLIKYMINKRIELACELLCTTDLSVSSVAYSCGFSDEIHFMKTFKKNTGKSALGYRRAASSNLES